MRNRYQRLGDDMRGFRKFDTSYELFERDAECELIDAAIAEVRSGPGRALLFAGPSGIGKTSLLHAAREQGLTAGLVVLRARGGELERGFPFGVVRQLFEARLATVSGTERDELFAGVASCARPLFNPDPELQHTGRHAEAMLGMLLHGLYWLTGNLAARDPLLLVVDDAHWADTASLHFMSYLVARLDELPVLAVLANRPGEPGANSELVSLIAVQPHVEVVKPAPLSPGAVTRMVREMMGSSASDRFCLACHAATEGNPFLVGELLGELIAGGIPPSDSRADTVRSLGPRTIAQNVLHRLARLPASATQLARAVAIFEGQAEFRHTMALCDLEPSTATQAADWLRRVEVLHMGMPLRFVHPVVRTAIYEDLSWSERSQGHLRAARMLTEEGRPSTQVAAHLLLAAPRADPWVVQTLTSAAERSLSDGVPATAVRYLRRALTEPVATTSRPELLARLGHVELLAGATGAAAEHLVQALDLTTRPGPQAAIGVDLARALTRSGRVEESAAMLRRLITQLETVDRGLTVPLQAELISAARIRPGTQPIVSAHLARLADLAEATGSPAKRVLQANLAVETALTGGSADSAVELAERALAGGVLPGEEDSESVYCLAAWSLALADRLSGARQALDHTIVEAREQGWTVGLAAASCFRAWVHHRGGRLLDAEADARNALRAAAGSWELGLPVATTFLVQTLVERDELGSADRVLERAGRETPALSTFTALLYGRGVLRVAQGRVEEGLVDLLDCGGKLTELGWWNAALPWRTDAALALARLGRRDEAMELAREGLRLAQAFNAPSPIAVAQRTLGLLKGGEPGRRLLGEAARLLEGSPVRLERARTLVELGGALRRAGQRRRAREQLRMGFALAEECGAVAIANHARTELRTLGVRVHRAATDGATSLTAGERRVARLAAEGLGNREIAQALFISLKTVEWHLTSTYRKLAIGTRAELANVLARREER